MKRLTIVCSLAAALVFGMNMARPAFAQPATLPASSSYVADLHPGLAAGVLSYARVSALPDGVLIESEDTRVTDAVVASEIAKAPEELRPQLTANAFFIAEQVATRPLVLKAARAYIAQSKLTLPDESEAALLGAYQRKIMGSVNVTDAEVAEFYAANKDMCGGATLEQVKDQLATFVRQQKQQEAMQQEVRDLGKHTPIRVSARWAAQQAQAAKDNPVDRARSGGTPTMVDFGADGCRPCDMMTPILEVLKTKYAGKVNVMFVHVRKEPVLAARYGIESIPVQVFFDAGGKEVFRHTGFFPQAEVEKQLASMVAK